MSNEHENVAAPVKLWEPTATQRAGTRIAEFEGWLARERGLKFAGYEELWQWSVDEPNAFWRAIWDHFDLIGEPLPTKMLSGSRMPGASWCPGLQLNFVDQVLRHDSTERPAIVFASEALGHGEISWEGLRAQVQSMAVALSDMGVEPGDRVAAYLPNVPQTVIAFLAVASLGAIWSVCSPDMGQLSVLDRFRQITPKVLIVCDGYRYGGKNHDRRSVVETLLAELPSVEHVIRVSLLPEDVALPGLNTDKNVHAWESCSFRDEAGFVPVRVDFSHPLWIVYSSGTTGLPKPIVHGHGGILINSIVFSALHNDLRPEDRFHWISSTGWIVWNIQVTALLLGTTIVLFDGSPTGTNSGTQDWTTVWRFVSDYKINVFGAGAAFYANCLKAGVRPREECDLTHLRALGSTGSPLSPEAYRWIYSAVGNIWLNCASGGTDIAGAFLIGHPGLPVYEGEMQCRTLGIAVYSYNDAGLPVIDEVGELVCTKAMPAMPLFFWNDTGDVRYLESYFDTFKHDNGDPIWRHGDWLKLVSREGAVGGIIYGRSDATINRHGVRMGTAEVYRAVEAIDEVIDSVVVDLEYLGRESYMPLFVALRPGLVLDETLEKRIRMSIRTALTPRHEPNDIFQVEAIPRTLTGKKLELPLKKLFLGQPAEKVINRDAMSNPESIEWFIDFARGLP